MFYKEIILGPKSFSAQAKTRYTSYKIESTEKQVMNDSSNSMMKE